MTTTTVRSGGGGGGGDDIDSATWAEWCAQRCLDEAQVLLHRIDDDATQTDDGGGERQQAVRQWRRELIQYIVRTVEALQRRYARAADVGARDGAATTTVAMRRQRAYDEAEAWLLWLQREHWAPREMERYERRVRAWSRRALVRAADDVQHQRTARNAPPATSTTSSPIAAHRSALPRPPRRVAIAAQTTS